MCADYWNLTADITCPSGHVTKDANLQTHFMGDMSCMHYYRLGEPVAELKPVKDGWISEFKDDFIAECDACRVGHEYEWLTFDGRVEGGAIVELRLIPEAKP